MKNGVSTVVIVGGGSSGWMAAALLSHFLGQQLSITLIESSDIGTVGVGEATIPPIRTFNDVLGIKETDFLKQTGGTIKLGIQFENWDRQGDCYMHAFGEIGRNLGIAGFHHYWLKARHAGVAEDFWSYSLNEQAARHNRFTPMNTIPGTKFPGLAHAYHLDAGLYAQMLRAYSEKLGVNHVDGKVQTVNKEATSGDIASVQLESGEQLAADLFIDCSGFRALLIGEALGVGYEDWSHWLPCDRALAVPSEAAETITPYTRAIAHEGGWQWRIPLQHRTGNGLVYSHRHLSDDEAAHTLLSNLDTPALADPRPIRFKTGRRVQQWCQNVVSLGLSSGFLEPLESTSLHLVQQGLTRLIKLFPRNGIQPSDIEEYNRQSQIEFEKIRDFIILHYHLNSKTDSPFWRMCREAPKPESLLRRIDLFAGSGRVFREQDELFSETAWEQVMIGQGITPKDYHPLVDNLEDHQLREFMNSWQRIVDKTVAQMPSHNHFLDSLK
ncbi:tryptophan halogenase family protein [Marinimicrobium koreense]|uniref:tryptophan halogenase family protein n=1 Tax=Marinimicrobium koreense TaxID=306545 RepID=UPI003F70C2DD